MKSAAEPVESLLVAARLLAAIQVMALVVVSMTLDVAREPRLLAVLVGLVMLLAVLDEPRAARLRVPALPVTTGARTLLAFALLRTAASAGVQLLDHRATRLVALTTVTGHIPVAAARFTVVPVTIVPHAAPCH